MSHPTPFSSTYELAILHGRELALDAERRRRNRHRARRLPSWWGDRRRPAPDDPA